jgi:iron(III) transport system permease protein
MGFVLIGYVLYPFAMTVLRSLHVNGVFSFGHYQALLDPASRTHWEAVWNSVVISILSVLFGGIVGVFFAVVFTQFDFPLKQVLSRLAVLPIALPPLVGVIAFLFVYGESGFVPRAVQSVLMLEHVPFYLEGRAAILVVHVYSFYVYFYLFVSTALRQLDSSLVEAASSLGSAPWRTFRLVVLPELRPALIAGSILTFMASMASFSAPFLFGGGHRFMTTQIYATKLNGELDLAAAQSVLLTIVSVGFFISLHALGWSRLSARRSKGAVRVSPMKASRTTKRVMLAVAVLLLAIELLPILTILIISFVQEGSWTWQILPTSYTLQNYARLLSDAHVFEPLRNSLLMSVIALSSAILIGVTAAYLLTKGGLQRLRFIFDVLMTLPFAVPGTAVAIGLIIAFNSPNVFSGYTILVGSFWILPLAYFVRTYPLVIRSTSAALEQLDDSLMEAAETFGAGVLRRFRTIALPIILPGIVSGSLLTMIAALGEFVSSILLYTYSSRPISVEILSQLRGYNFGPAAAYCVVLLGMILALTFLSNVLTRRSPGGVSGFNF